MAKLNACLLLVVVAFCMAAATPTLADGANFYSNPRDVECQYGDRTVTVTVDGNYACEHPEQVGLQADAVVTRGRVGELEDQVGNHETRLDNLERGQQVVVVGQPAPAVVVPPAQPVYVPSGTPAGGPATNQPAVPAKESTMPDFLAVLGYLGIAGIAVWIAVVLGQRGRGQNSLPNYQTALPLFQGAFRGFYAGADGSSASYVGTLVGGNPAQPGQLPAAPAVPALPAATPTNLQRAQAQAALAAYAPPLANPNGTNLDVLTQAMISNGIDGSVPALVTQQLALLVGTGQVS